MQRNERFDSADRIIWVGFRVNAVLMLFKLAASLTSFIILHIGYQTFRDSAHDLMDGNAPPDFITEVTRLT